MKTTITLSIEEILLDANVMIDLKGTHNTDIASLLSRSLRVAIVEQTRRKVSGLTPSLCKRIGASFKRPPAVVVLPNFS